MSPRSGHVGGLKMQAPLGVEEERALYPVIERGRIADAALTGAEVIDADERRRLLRQRQEGQEAESLLLSATCGLVRARVLERGYRFGDEELEAAGVEGLVNALRRFDPRKGVRFATYANYWITKLVNLTIQQQTGLSDTEMRLVVQLQRLERSQPDHRFSEEEVAERLAISPARAKGIIHTTRELVARRFESTDFEGVAESKAPGGSSDAPAWVEDVLRQLCGDDFDSFWQYAFKTMSVEEIAKSKGISRQAMSKRLDRCKRAVRESPEAQRLQAWFHRQ